MIPAPFPRGSVQEAAFKAALALPIRAASPDSTPFERVAAFLLSGCPEVRFPTSAVRAWLEKAGIGSTVACCGSAASKLNDAFVDMLNLEDQLSRDAALPNRQKAGARRSLRAALSRIGESATRLSADLQIVREELRYRQTLGEECTGLNRLHAELHDAVSFWHYQILRMGMADQPAATSLAPFDQCGLPAMALETWLEHGCNSIAAIARRAAEHESDSVGHSGSRKARIREHFIRQVAAAWAEATGLRPSVRAVTDEKLSPFQIFYAQVCGHTAGLVALEEEWSELSVADEAGVKIRLQALGLLVLPAASTLRRALNSAPNFP